MSGHGTPRVKKGGALRVRRGPVLFINHFPEDPFKSKIRQSLIPFVVKYAPGVSDR